MDEAIVTTPMVLVATWRDGLFVVSGETRDQSTDDGSMDTIRWSPSAKACPHGPTASSTPVASPRAARQSRSPIRRAISGYQPTPAVAGRAEPVASHLRAASSSSESQQKASP
jgi:hypothetical protein